MKTNPIPQSKDKPFSRFFRWQIHETSGHKTIAQLYNDIARDGFYDRRIKYPDRVASLRRSLSHLPIRPRSILDIACGTGAVIDALPDIRNCTVTGIDASQEMLNIARKRFKSKPNVRFKQADLFTYSYPRDAYDLVTFANSSRFIPKGQEDEFIKKMYRTLRRDGLLWVVLNSGVFQYPAAFVNRYLGIPRKSNWNMNYASEFCRYARKYFNLIRTDRVQHNYLILNSVALLFQKKTAPSIENRG